MFYILDTETTGLVKPTPCEIAFVEIDEELNILSEVSTLVNPLKEIDAGATGIHGITNNMVIGKPTMEEVKSLLPSDFKIIGHNIGFDLRAIKPHIKPSMALCTLSLARQYVKNTSNHKLETLQRELNLPIRKSHSALGDCLTVLDLLKYITNFSGVNLNTMFLRAQEPRMISVMPYGKHKGKRLLDVPRGYRSWLLNQADVGKDLKFSLERLDSI